MFRRLYLFVFILVVYSPNALLAQDDGSGFEQEESGSEFSEDEGSGGYQELYVSFDQESGNINNLVTGLEYSYSLVGDMGPLTDTEFSMSLAGNYTTINDEPYSLDGSVHIQTDLWANQKYSPFFFFDNSFDRSIGLINRTNFAIGGKMRVGSMLSVSYAYMYEEEKYDTVAVFARHSIRPKIKLVLSEGALFFDLRTFYKPKVDDFDDYLLENIAVLSIATFSDALTIDVTLKHSFNSRYKGDNKVLKPAEDWDSEYNPDFGSYDAIETFYKDTDMSLSVGFSFAF